MLNPSGVAFESADYPRIEASDVNPPSLNPYGFRVLKFEAADNPRIGAGEMNPRITDLACSRSPDPYDPRSSATERNSFGRRTPGLNRWAAVNG